MNVLITGKSSRIGNRLKQHLEASGTTVDMISMHDESWKELDLSAYDALVHAAAIAHQKDEPGLEQEYMRVNAHMTNELAQKAKADGVGCFVFLSTMGVYGVNGDVKRMVVIDKNTPLTPDNLYGKSKLAAEELITPLADDGFKVCVLRAPLVYGKDCKGNYARLRSMVLKLPVMPKVNNQRSMIHVLNLCEFIRLLLDNPVSGTFFPQNREYVNTHEMLANIANAEGKNLRFSDALGGIMNSLFGGMGVVRKVFGNLVFDKDMSNTFDFEYCIIGFEDSFKE